MFIEQEMMVGKLAENKGKLDQAESKFIDDLQARYVGHKFRIITPEQHELLWEIYDKNFPSRNGKVRRYVRAIIKGHLKKLTDWEVKVVMGLRQKERDNLYFDCTEGQANVVEKLWERIRRRKGVAA